MKTIKDLLEIMREHAKADRLVQGNWLRDKDSSGIFRGCFYGCAMQSDSDPIEAACNEYDLPLWIGFWSEKVFERLSEDEAIKWPVQLLEALVDFTGDYEDIRHKLAVKRLTYLSERNEGEVKAVIDGVIEHHKTRDEDLRESAADAAWSAADAAARSAARSAAKSAAWSAARSAADAADAATDSAAWSARSAAESAADSTWSAARSAWKRERDWMLGLLKEQGE